jgi:NAD(P)-dependent dehydrogenase (short-subunit alcohol dehydrogenase family)
MTLTALVTGADRGIGSALCAGLLTRGWRVFAGQNLPDWPELPALAAHYPGQLSIVPLDVSSLAAVQAAYATVATATDRVDLLINNAGILGGGAMQQLRTGLNYETVKQVYDVNALGPLRMTEVFLPLTDRGRRRLVFVSSNLSSIAMSSGEGEVSYHMSKTALNMAVKIMFNDLRSQGYTFRLYHPGWVRTYLRGKKNMAATFEPAEAAAEALTFFLQDREDEDRLVLIDYKGEEWPF